MLRTALRVSALLLVLLVLTPVQAQERPSTLRSQDRFDGATRVRVRDPRGQTQINTVNVRIENWTIDGGQKVAALPLRSPGLMVVQMRGGQMTTVIAGKRQERREDDFWTVPAGVQMGIETRNDTATFQTIVVNER